MVLNTLLITKKNKKVKLSCIMLPKRSGYVKCFDETK